jgi:hypothetical protein
MQGLTSELVHDASSVFRLIDQIKSFAESTDSSKAYTRASKEFLAYVSLLSTSTLAYLDRFPDLVPEDKSLAPIFLQKLSTIRSGWFELHQFVKATADADSLHIPGSLIECLTERLNFLPGFESARFAVFHAPELNYFFLNASYIRNLVDSLSRIVPNAPEFPPDLGLTAIPYSQSAAFFLNCLIPHEMGHYVFQASEERKTLESLENQIIRAITHALSPRSTELTREEVYWAYDRLRTWAQEIFCDLFAVWMVGPAYTYAFIELLNLGHLPSSDETTRLDLCEFSITHPASLFRLKQQSALLQDLGWWSFIGKTDSHYARVIREVQGSSLPYTFPHSKPSSIAQEILAAVVAITPAIGDVLRTLVAGLDTGGKDCEMYDAHIQEYLSRGVVPSTIVHDDTFHHPTPIAIMNSACKFYLEGIEPLLNRLLVENRTSISTRSQWINRLELWVSKALEDSLLLHYEVPR